MAFFTPGRGRSGYTPRLGFCNWHTKTYEQALRVAYAQRLRAWAAPVNRDVLDEDRPKVPQSRCTRVKHSEGYSGRD